MGRRKDKGRLLPLWAKFLIASGIILFIQFFLPDPVVGVINAFLHRPNVSLYTGLSAFLRFLLVIWRVSGWGLLVATIVAVVRGRRRSGFE